MPDTRQDPLLPVASAAASPLATVWACINLFATTVGAGILSVPICFGYCGSSLLALLLLAVFMVLSAASLLFIAGAAARTGAHSYLHLGERCYGRTGASFVLWSLMGLLCSAVVQVMIIIVDLAEMLLARYAPVWMAPSRTLLFVIIAALEVPLCLPRELHQLRFTSSLSVIAILFTCACIVELAISHPSSDGVGADGADGAGGADGTDEATPQTAGDWLLAMPIFSLAYCSQFNVLDLAQTLPKASRDTTLPTVVYVAMGGAFCAYALVGLACYALLGDTTLRYPNVLTAFGSVPLVAFGSLAIACVNYLKMPLVRALPISPHIPHPSMTFSLNYLKMPLVRTPLPITPWHTAPRAPHPTP